MSKKSIFFCKGPFQRGPITSQPPCLFWQSQEDQPFNVAVVMLDEDPGIQMYSHLPGVPADEVPVGANVEVIFEKLPNGQNVPEWKISN